MSTVLRVLKGYKPIQYLGDSILLSKGFDLYRSDLSLCNFEFVASLPSNALKRMLVKSRIITRLLRLDIGPSCFMPGSDSVLVCASKKIYKVELGTGRVTVDFSISKGNRPLGLSKVEIDGFTTGVYFGEYLSNPNKTAVNIYRRSAKGEWRVGYTFEAGEINHVHAVVPDAIGKCVYVLTGDFGNGAGIWRAKDDFQKVERLVCQGQESRACWLKLYGDRLYFATDTQLEANYFSSVCVSSDGVPDIVQHFPVLGSSIYSLSCDAPKLVFSTAVEPDEIKRSTFAALLSRRRGPGILSDCAAVYAGSISGSVRLLLTGKKDWMPFRLFQFGSFQFPAGTPPQDGTFHVYGVALKGYDDATILLQCDRLDNV